MRATARLSSSQIGGIAVLAEDFAEDVTDFTQRDAGPHRLQRRNHEVIALRIVARAARRTSSSAALTAAGSRLVLLCFMRSTCMVSTRGSIFRVGMLAGAGLFLTCAC